MKLHFNQRATDSVEIERGARQGCYKSLMLLSVDGEYLMKDALAEVGDFKNGGRIINKIRFSDDTVIIAKTQEELKDMLTLEGKMA